MLNLLLSVTFILASLIQGEAGVCGPRGRIEVARSVVARHRVLHESWQEALGAFYGRAEPDELSTMIASRTLSSNGMPYVLSDDDLIRLDIVHPPDLHIQCAGGLGLNFYRRWPKTFKTFLPYFVCWHQDATSGQANSLDLLDNQGALLLKHMKASKDAVIGQPGKLSNLPRGQTPIP